ncbi:MAG TPA: electron transport complex subunit E [Oscillospiraceae bacterium]|nr:electron transport complex subunit E [Oscillospiraceae bacterium]
MKKVFMDGLIGQNPVLVQLLGMCSTMAITTSLFNGVGMGIGVMAVLICSNIIISLLRKIIPKKIRIAAFIVVISAFVTIVELLLQAYKPDLADSLGVFLPLIVVNCIILGRAEAFASRNSVGRAAVDGVAQGLGYTLVLLAICVIREFLGKGTFGAGLLNGGAGIQIFPSQYGALLIVLPFGGFLTLACLIAFVQWQRKRLSEKPAESTLREEAAK